MSKSVRGILALGLVGGCSELRDALRQLDFGERSEIAEMCVVALVKSLAVWSFTDIITMSDTRSTASLGSTDALTF